MIKKLKFFIIFIKGGILSLTDSHHNHHGQKPTMVGICHGGNVLGNHEDDDDDDEYDDDDEDENDDDDASQLKAL